MADTKISALDVVSGLDGTEVVPVLQDGANARTTVQAIADLAPTAAVYAGVCNGRLTLTSGTPVTTSDVTAATTIYFAPYKGNQVALYDGSAWVLHTFTQRSLSVPATTATMYDVFLYDNAGTLTLEAVAWTNDTTRATALTTQDGIYVKTGALTRRYLGSFRTTGVSGQTEDSLVKRYVWNYYHRAVRLMRRSDGTDSWVYSSTSFQQANANAANQLDIVVGVSEDGIKVDVYGTATSSTSTARAVIVGIGVNSTSVNSASIVAQCAASSLFANSPTASYQFLPAVGRTYLAWLERGAGVDTQTWYGDAGAPTTVQSGIFGSMLA